MKKSVVSFLRKDGAHLLLLVAGAALFIGGCFQNSQWFDEAYTVGLMQHSLSGVLYWATFDVHPHLYYVLLKLFTLLFGRSLPVMRLFSALGAILLASLGYTHLRRDFGKAVGFWFSFCVIFCSQTLAYALAIRMYTWAAFFVALAAIYAYRMANEPNKRNRVLFLVFALCASYTHYFGLFAAAMMQFLLLLRIRAGAGRAAASGWSTAPSCWGRTCPGSSCFCCKARRAEPCGSASNGRTWCSI